MVADGPGRHGPQLGPGRDAGPAARGRRRALHREGRRRRGPAHRARAPGAPPVAGAVDDARPGACICPRRSRGEADPDSVSTGGAGRGTSYERTADIYRQAGELLGLLHRQLAVPDDSYEQRENERTLDNLRKPHRIVPEFADRLRSEIEGWPTPAATLVPTHGDWQPRNWLVHEGIVSVIDFGRAALRPAYTDFARLGAQQFRTESALENAFLDGYGADPRDPAAWHRAQLREAINTAVWAHQSARTISSSKGIA